MCVDHVTPDKLASYIIQGVLFPIISWPVHLLLHILKVHASHGNNDNDIAMLLLVLIANTQDCGTCQHHVCQRKQCHIMFHTCGKCPWKGQPKHTISVGPKRDRQTKVVDNSHQQIGYSINCGPIAHPPFYPLRAYVGCKVAILSSLKQHKPVLRYCGIKTLQSSNMWQSRVEIEHYSIVYFNRITV